MLEWTDEVLKHEDIEAFHMMRVALRRLRATLDAYQSCCEPKLFKKVYRNVKTAADVLGQARDTDVMLDYLAAQMAGLPPEERQGVLWLSERLQAYRREKQRELEVFLHRLDGEKLERQIRACVRERIEV